TISSCCCLKDVFFNLDMAMLQLFSFLFIFCLSQLIYSNKIISELCVWYDEKTKLSTFLVFLSGSVKSPDHSRNQGDFYEFVQSGVNHDSEINLELSRDKPIIGHWSWSDINDSRFICKYNDQECGFYMYPYSISEFNEMGVVFQNAKFKQGTKQFLYGQQESFDSKYVELKYVVIDASSDNFKFRLFDPSSDSDALNDYESSQRIFDVHNFCQNQN
ncbi:MAG: hypothetical protein OXE99_12900, partial [Cellvibrionales bacterium]|nr:hypothetical protein [Cellvibrionales bacterium]